MSATTPINMLDLQAEFALYGERIRAVVDEVLDSKQFINGPYVADLEKAVAKRLDVADAVAVTSGTDALLVSLMALGIGAGDEVITTPFTFFATGGCISRVGARPIFVDIEPDTFNIDPKCVAAAVTPKTKAIMPVHIFGQSVEMDALQQIADEHNLRIIEDNCQGIGAAYHDRPTGSLGDLGALSFYPTKNLGGFGEGGMVTAREESLGQRCRQLRNHGETSRYHHQFVGGNFRLDTMKAGILLAKLDHLDEFNNKRRANAAKYDELLSGVIQVQTPVIRDYNHTVYHQYCILCERRDELQAALRDAGIGSAIYYPVPLHLQECFADLGYGPGQLPVAEETAGKILALPIQPMLTTEQVERVAGVIKGFYE